MKRRITFAILLFILTGCSIKAKKEFVVTGKVARLKKPKAGVDIYAYRAESLLDFKSPDSVAKSDKDGLFSITLPGESDYYISAKTFHPGSETGSEAGSDQIDMYAMYGRSPVYVTKKGHSDINLNLQKSDGGVDYKKAEETGIKCILTHNGSPLSGATLYAALDLNEGMQTKGFIQSGLSDDSGECSLPVEEGRYYLTARKRLKGMYGPMAEGDLIGFFPLNPIVIDTKGSYTISIELVEIPKKVKDRTKSETNTVISGTVKDMDEEAVRGIWVGAYIDPQMFGKPVYMSQKSDKSGSYKLVIPKAGKYFLAARDTLGGPPNPGELYGSYNGTDDHSVTVETGSEMSGIDITVREMW